MLLELLKYQEIPDEWSKKDIVFVGPPNSGKTNGIRFLFELVRGIPEYQGKNIELVTNDMRIIGDKRYSKYFFDEGGNYKSVLSLAHDDAMSEGTDSRRAMSTPNVDSTQAWAKVRHTLEDHYGPNGILFMIYATQNWHRLDPTLREYAHLIIFTSYIRQKWFHKLFPFHLVKQIRDATHSGMFGSHFADRGVALFITNSGYVGAMKIPKIPKTRVQYPVIDRSIDKESVLEKLTETLIKKIPGRIEHYTRGQLHGFLDLERKKIEKTYYVKLRPTDFTRAINRADWKQTLDFEPESSRSFKPCESLKQKIMNLMEVKQVWHINKLSKLCAEEVGEISTRLSKNKNLFKNIARNSGFWCPTWYRPSQLEREELGLKTNKPMKTLQMEN